MCHESLKPWQSQQFLKPPSPDPHGTLVPLSSVPEARDAGVPSLEGKWPDRPGASTPKIELSLSLAEKAKYL